MIGTILNDRWRILSELGRGGMGEVYLAEHIKLDRQEALKILMPQLATDPQFVSRFRREARAVNRLRHPNIISLYDFGQLPDGRFYLSLEYANGELVNRIIRKHGAFDVPRALHVLGQLAYAVHHAHSRGVVHRDLKPGNLILVGDTLKVLDFGVAKIVASDHAESVALSTGNVVYGTPKYMSPERATGVGNDPRSDLYALGCIGFELVVGAPPFVGPANDVIRAHLSTPPPTASAVNPTGGIPPELDAVLLKCLAKNPDDRFQSAAEVFAALHKVPGYPIAKPEGRRRFVPVTTPPTAETLTKRSAQGEPYGNLRGALREVAEGLLDFGLSDARLVSGLAYLRDHEQTLAQLEAQQDGLEHEAAAVRETIGDREVSLRFAIGEMQFDASHAELSAEVAEQLRELEARLASAVAQGEQLRALENRIGGVAEARATVLEELKGAYDGLEKIVDDLLPHYVGDPTLAPLAHRLALVRNRRRSPR